VDSREIERTLEESFGEGVPRLRLLSSAFLFARESVVITDAELGPPGPRILAVNPAFCEMTGYSPQEVLGKTPRIFQGPRTDRAVLDRIRPTLEAREVFQGETYNYRKNGEEFLIRWYVTPILDGAGKVEFYLAVQRDATESHRLRSIAQTVNAMENLGYVFSGVRHELSHPVNSAKAALTLVQLHLETLPREKLKAYLDGALEELGRIEYLLRTLRSFSAFEDVVVEELEVGPFMDRLISVLQRTFTTTEVALQLLLPPEAPGQVLADPRALHQVLLNLVSNAVDALEGRPSPTVTLRLESEARQLLLVVADNGVGMTGSQLQDLFKPFHSSKAKGTGLGLVLSRKLVTKMGGSLTLESERGAGTVATIRLEKAR
jgi:PAS domain S-box-containing protein